MIKIGILGIAIVCLALPLKNMKEEYSLYLSIGADGQELKSILLKARKPRSNSTQTKKVQETLPKR